jgi:hypothetical protein
LEILGDFKMRKLVLILAVAAVAAAPTAALAAKKKAKGPKVYDTTAANQNESAGRFMRDAFWSIGVKGPAFTGKEKM